MLKYGLASDPNQRWAWDRYKSGYYYEGFQHMFILYKTMRATSAKWSEAASILYWSLKLENHATLKLLNKNAGGDGPFLYTPPYFLYLVVGRSDPLPIFT